MIVKTYLVLEKSGTYYPKGKVVKHSKGKPDLVPGQIAIKLNITLPDTAFSPPTPEFDLTVADANVIVPQVEIEEAAAPTGDGTP